MTDPTSQPERLTPLIATFKKDDLEIIISLVAMAALADGKIDQAELDALKEALEAAFASPLSLMVVKTLVGDAVSRIRAAGEDTFAKELGRELGEKKMGEDGLRVAFTITAASNGVSDVERARLTMIGIAAGLTEEAILAIEREVV